MKDRANVTDLRVFLSEFVMVPEFFERKQYAVPASDITAFILMSKRVSLSAICGDLCNLKSISGLYSTALPQYYS